MIRSKRSGFLAVAALLFAASSLGAQPSADAKPALERWLREYDSAFNAKDVQALAAFYRPDVTVFEEGADSHGWDEYHTKHLAPELQRMEHPVLFHVHHTARSVSAAGDAFLIVAEPRLRAEMAGGLVDVRFLETLLVVKDDHGAWKILHAHRSVLGQAGPLEKRLAGAKAGNP